MYGDLLTKAFARRSCFNSSLILNLCFGNSTKRTQAHSRICSSFNYSSKKMSSTFATIGTHNGKFHCDEVLACAMLKFLPRFAQAEIIRTRDEEILKTCDLVLDVGGVYDPSSYRFDHHQRSFTDTMQTLIPGKRWTTRLSSAGLIYVHYGREVLSAILDIGKHDDRLEKLYDKVYENFVEEIDANDNGISLNEYPMAYKVTTTLGHRVANLNPSWRDTNPDETSGFWKAMDLVREEFRDRVLYYYNDWLEAYGLVKDSIERRHEVDPSGKIVELPSGGCPWNQHLFDIEASLGIETPIQFVIFTDQNEQWRVQGVPIEPGSYILRTPLKKDWRGLRLKELEEVSQIPTIVFVHASGFIGGAKERSCVIRMAKETLADA